MVSKREEDYVLKVLLIGDSKSGKFNLIQEYLNKINDSKADQKQSKDFLHHVVEIDKKPINLQIWDTPGDPRFRSLIIPQFKGTRGIILVYSPNDRQTFLNIDKWISEIKEHTKEDVARVLIANKADADEEVEVTPKEGQAAADRLGIQFFKTSAKDSLAIKDMFLTLTRQMQTTVQEEIRQKEEEELQRQQELENVKKGKPGKIQGNNVKSANEQTQQAVPVKKEEVAVKEDQQEDAADKKYDHLLKFVLVGGKGVGKTSLVHQLEKKDFNEELPASTEVRVSKRVYKVHEKVFKAEIWDLPGSKDYWKNAERYYKDADGIVFVYDTTKRDSFNALAEYVTESQKYCPNPKLKVLIGTKTDLVPDRQVTADQRKTFAQSQHMESLETNVVEEGKSILSKVILSQIEKFNQPKKATNTGNKTASKEKEGCWIF